MENWMKIIMEIICNFIKTSAHSSSHISDEAAQQHGIVNNGKMCRSSNNCLRIGIELLSMPT